MMRRTLARPLPLLLLICALSAAPGAAGAQPAASPGGEEYHVRLDARFVDRASGLEAEWGSTGQVLLLPEPADPALAQWRGARSIATSPSNQSVTLAAGGRAAIRVGREIPFAGWFLRRGRLSGVLDDRAEWREVESALEFEALPPTADGLVHLVAIPEFGYQQGRSHRSVAFAELRGEVVLADGAETRFAPPPGQEDFFGHFFAGYDPLRRVRRVDLLLRATLQRPKTP